MQNDTITVYLKNASLVIISLLVLVFPLLFFTNTTDPFIFPKQLLTILFTLVLLILLFLRMIFEARVVIRSTPFNVPLLLFAAALLFSSFLSPNRYDSLIQTVPVLGLIALFFVIVNSIEDRDSYQLVVHFLMLGAALSTVVSMLGFFKVYLLPFSETYTPSFTSFGSPVQHIVYLLPLCFISLWSFVSFIKKKRFDFELFFFFFWILAMVGFIGVFFYGLFSSSLPKPIFLPFTYGVQIAFASISQDTKRFLLSLLFGSGFGTFTNDFTRFRLSSFNQEKDIWNLIFSYSSSFFLELLSTTGIVGALTFLFLFLKTVRSRTSKQSLLYFAIVLLFLLSFLLPFSFSVLFLLFILLSLYSSHLYLERSAAVYNITLSLVALRQGFINLETEKGYHPERSESPILPIVFFLCALLVSGFVGIVTVKLFVSDLAFKQSLTATSLKYVQKTYDLERQAITTFPYKSDYYRVFSQVNFSIASSLAASNPNSDATASAQAQQTALTLIQQSINSAKTAATLAPATSLNWINLSQIYRSLINVGQNADQFALATLAQAIVLDPINPQLYIDLGGLYFQLMQYDNAATQFQTAVNLKQDLPNAYYNLGHAFEAKGDLKGAIAEYQRVKILVSKDKQNYEKISAEIDALEKRIGQEQKQEAEISQKTPTLEQTQNQTPLTLSTPSAKLPARKPPVKIPAPPQASESAR